MLLMIDNYDFFTFTSCSTSGSSAPRSAVVRNDGSMSPALPHWRHPAPGDLTGAITPTETGVRWMIGASARQIDPGRLPGHQSIGQAFWRQDSVMRAR